MRVLCALPVVLVVSTTIACRDGSRHRSAAAADSQRATPAHTAAGGAVVYHGAGFSLDLPPGSTVARGDSTDTLRGPGVTEPERSPDIGGPGPHPTFDLMISVYPNLARRSLSAWGDSVHREYSEGAEDFSRPGPIEPDTLGSEPALAMATFCGDCEAREIYVARDDRIVRFYYAKGIHLARARDPQEGAYRHVLRTFRWTP